MGTEAIGECRIGARAFDLPSFIPWESVKGSQLVPIHMFRVVLDELLKKSGTATQARARSRQKRDNSEPLKQLGKPTPLPLDRACLGCLEKWLPGSWTDIAIANKAFKSDNAVVDFYPWNQHIMLVLLCPVRSIVSFEEFRLRMWRQNLASSFRGYLVDKHGADWAVRLRSYFQDMPIREPELKRRRVHETLTALLANNKGVEGEKERSQVKELERDVIKGRRVLRQVLQSK